MLELRRSRTICFPVANNQAFSQIKEQHLELQFLLLRSIAPYLPVFMTAALNKIRTLTTNESTMPSRGVNQCLNSSCVTKCIHEWLVQTTEKSYGQVNERGFQISEICFIYLNTVNRNYLTLRPVRVTYI